MVFGKLFGSALFIAIAAPSGFARADAEAALYLMPGGLELATHQGSRVIAMGEANRSEAVEIASTVWSEPLSEYAMAECGYGDMQFAEFESGVTLTFDDDAFIGWMTAPDATARTVDGVGAGSPVRDIEAVAGPVETFESSIGHEFAADNLYGVADGPGTKAHIAMLWSGVSCIFR